jgi:hypothetical protein
MRAEMFNAFFSLIKDCYDLPMFAELRVLSDSFTPPSPIADPGTSLYPLTNNLFCQKNCIKKIIFYIVRGTNTIHI